MPVELLVPCGSIESAKIAAENGADAVYAGLTNLSMRPKRVEFNGENGFKQLVDYAHSKGMKLYAAVNVYMKKQDKDLFKITVEKAVESDVDALILSDLGAISYVRETYPQTPIHISVCTSVANADAAKFYEDLGVSVVVVSRSLDDFNEIKKIRQAVSAGLEAFIHGGICYMYDGDCYLSSYWKQVWDYDEHLGADRLYGQNNTKGECQLICKRECSLVKNGQEVVASGRLLRRHDQVGLFNLPSFIDAGINILKIEGRAMPLDYVAKATKLYREAIDLCTSKPQSYSVKDEWLPVVEELVNARFNYDTNWHIK